MFITLTFISNDVQFPMLQIQPSYALRTSRVNFIGNDAGELENARVFQIRRGRG